MKNNESIYVINNREIVEYPINEISGIRPTLVLKANLFTTYGDGTRDKPYRVGDYKVGNADDLLNERIIGEYVNYSGTLFRISGFDENNNIKLTSVDCLRSDDYVTASYGFGEDDDIEVTIDENGEEIPEVDLDEYVFDPKNEASIGYKLNSKYIDYIDESLIVNHDYVVYQFSKDKKYDKYKQKKKFKAKLSIPSSYDLFSGAQFGATSSDYWLLDYVENTALTNNGYLKMRTEFGFKIVIYLSKNAKILKGNGTIQKPYYVR